MTVFHDVWVWWFFYAFRVCCIRKSYVVYKKTTIFTFRLFSASFRWICFYFRLQKVNMLFFETISYMTATINDSMRFFVNCRWPYSLLFKKNFLVFFFSEFSFHLISQRRILYARLLFFLWSNNMITFYFI